MSKKKVLIIGGAGFIGSSISKYLLKNRDYEIHVADNFFRGSSRLSDLRKSIEIFVFYLAQVKHFLCDGRIQHKKEIKE